MEPRRYHRQALWHNCLGCSQDFAYGSSHPLHLLNPLALDIEAGAEGWEAAEKMRRGPRARKYPSKPQHKALSCRLWPPLPHSGPILEARWNSELGPAMEACKTRPSAVWEETSKVTARHGRRLNGKTKVTNVVEVKEEADHDGAAQHLQELTPAEM